MNLQTTRAFVSYSRKNKDFVEKLVGRLQNRCAVWWDQRLTPAEIWWLTIIEAIEKCDCFVLVLTPPYTGSAFCLAELEYAQALGKPLLSIIPDRSVKFPPNVSHSQAAFIDGFSVSEAYGEIIAGVSGLRSDQYAPTNGTVPRPPEPTISGQAQLSDLFADAAEAQAIGNLALAERFYEPIAARDRGELGRLAREELDSLRQLRKCRSDYENITRLANQPGTLGAAIKLWGVYRRADECGADYDPNNYAGDPRFNSASAATPLFILKPTTEQQRLLDIMLDAKRPIAERANAGDELAALGDPRPGVGLRPDGLPDIEWCSVPAGEFTMGGQEDSDNPVRTINVPAFRIAKYPVTYRQFQAFIDVPDGYRNVQWWQGLHADGLNQQKLGPGDQNWKVANRPRENVSWYDAMAFCHWLSDKLGYPITLPTEEQWEKAARATDRRIYPYGNTFDAAKGNTSKTGLSQTSAVGLFAAGELPYHVLDMSGNVWEWTLTEYETRKPNNINSNSRRAVRGGSWGLDQDLARTAFRLNYDLVIRFSYLGLRLASPAVF